jgi:hypothetical protein
LLLLLLKQCRDDDALWRGRFPANLHATVDTWQVCVRPPRMYL